MRRPNAHYKHQIVSEYYLGRCLDSRIAEYSKRETYFRHTLSIDEKQKDLSGDKNHEHWKIQVAI